MRSVTPAADEASAYRVALSVLVAAVLAALLCVLAIRETYCRPHGEN